MSPLVPLENGLVLTPGVLVTFETLTQRAGVDDIRDVIHGVNGVSDLPRYRFLGVINLHDPKHASWDSLVFEDAESPRDMREDHFFAAPIYERWPTAILAIWRREAHRVVTLFGDDDNIAVTDEVFE